MILSALAPLAMRGRKGHQAGGFAPVRHPRKIGTWLELVFRRPPVGRDVFEADPWPKFTMSNSGGFLRDPVA
jgi:hypothetical protein